MFKPAHVYVILCAIALLFSYLAASSIVPDSGSPIDMWFGAMSFFFGVAGVVLAISALGAAGE